jgi:Arc/MetJ family transcription regulator
MRISIEIDEQLMAEALRLSGARTKRETVEMALRDFVRRRERGALARELAGKIPWVGDLDAMRTDSIIY